MSDIYSKVEAIQRMQPVRPDTPAHSRTNIPPKIDILSEPPVHAEDTKNGATRPKFLTHNIPRDNTEKTRPMPAVEIARDATSHTEVRRGRGLFDKITQALLDTPDFRGKPNLMKRATEYLMNLLDNDEDSGETRENAKVNLEDYPKFLTVEELEQEAKGIQAEIASNRDRINQFEQEIKNYHDVILPRIESEAVAIRKYKEDTLNDAGEILRRAKDLGLGSDVMPTDTEGITADALSMLATDFRDQVDSRKHKTFDSIRDFILKDSRGNVSAATRYALAIQLDITASALQAAIAQENAKDMERKGIYTEINRNGDRIESLKRDLLVLNDQLLSSTEERDMLLGAGKNR